MKRFSNSSATTLPAIAPLLLLALALGGCGAKHETPEATLSRLPAVQVRVQTADVKLHATTEEVVGTVRAKLRATLEAKLSGQIESLPVALGQKIKAGQLVARLDAAEIKARLDQAEATLVQAGRDWQRVSALFGQQAATRSEYDAAESRQQVAKGAVAEARAMMSYMEVVAPFDGVVTKKWADAGDLAMPGKPLVDLESPSALQLEADVPEAIAARIHPDDRLAVRMDSLNGELVGPVSEIAPATDPLSHTFRVKIDLPPTAGLMSGQFARLVVPVGEGESVRVPASAIVTRGQLEIVFVVTHQCARLHLVKTGKRFGDEVEMLSGLDAGDAVVITGAAQLTDGQPVEAK